MTLVPVADFWPSDEFASVVLEAHELGVELQGLGIRFTNPPQLTEDDTDCWCLLREIIWTESDWREYLVKLASATTGDATTLYAPNTLTKVGSADYKRLPLGQLSQYRALTAARWFLRQSVSRVKVRTYGTDAPPSPLPRRGQTIQASDGFIGVCLSRMFDMKAPGSEYLEVRLLDMTSGADD